MLEQNMGLRRMHDPQYEERNSRSALSRQIWANLALMEGVWREREAYTRNLRPSGMHLLLLCAH